MTEFRVSGRSDLDAGEDGSGTSDAPMDVAMELPTAATVGATLSEPMERNNNGKWRKSREAPAAPSDWRSLMERIK